MSNCWRWSLIGLILPLCAEAQSLRFEVGGTVTRSLITAVQPDGTYKNRVVLPGTFYRLSFGYPVYEFSQIEFGLRHTQHNVGIDYGANRGSVRYRHSFWQIPLVLNTDCKLWKNWYFDFFLGVNASRSDAAAVFDNRTESYYGLFGQDEPVPSYDGKVNAFGYEGGCGFSYRFNDNVVGISYTYSRPFDWNTSLTLSARHATISSVSNLSLHAIGLYYRRDLR